MDKNNELVEENIGIIKSLSESDKSVDELSDITSLYPTSLFNFERDLKGTTATITVETLSGAIKDCIKLLENTTECSEERIRLVKHIVKLREKLQQAQENSDDTQNEELKECVVFGHHFKLQSQLSITSAVKDYCDRCCALLWNFSRSWYQCIDCDYKCHIKCVKTIQRICPHVILSENPYYEPQICPEEGLSKQNYRCLECQSDIAFTFPKNAYLYSSKGLFFENPFSSENSLIEAKQCDYNGRYYCSSCHWNNTSVIPARVIKSWDFVTKPVSRASYQFLNYTKNRPMIVLNQILYSVIEELATVKKMREELMKMKLYISTCRQAMDSSELKKELEWRRHLIHSSEVFSLNDLIDLKNGYLIPRIETVRQFLMKHIKEDCQICFGRGFICKSCPVAKDVLFPFDENSYVCPKCSNVQHYLCWNIHKTCPKCNRMEMKKIENLKLNS